MRGRYCDHKGKFIFEMGHVGNQVELLEEDVIKKQLLQKKKQFLLYLANDPSMFLLTRGKL